MSQSSLFILNKNSKLRQRLLVMTSSPDIIINESLLLKAPEQYGINDLKSSVAYSEIKFNKGMIITTKRGKLSSQIFEGFIIVCILLASLSLCIMTPISDPNSASSRALLIVDVIFTFVFAIEALTKILASGFYTSSYPEMVPYIKNGWNILDF